MNRSESARNENSVTAVIIKVTVSVLSGLVMFIFGFMWNLNGAFERSKQVNENLTNTMSEVKQEIKEVKLSVERVGEKVTQQGEQITFIKEKNRIR